ncbi:MAG: tRNA preQ1(34) S-adenosylmethionine ribosyltransferase-isomerase QueA [Rhodospirillales bacterium]
MRVDEFDFDLPAGLIAQRPPPRREDARLLHVRGGALDDRAVGDLPGLLRRGDLLVLNNTRVLPCRLTGQVNGARVELTLHKAEPGQGAHAAVWRALAKPARKLKPGARVEIAPGFACDVLAKGAPPESHGGEVTLGFDIGHDDIAEKLRAHGAMPLPPYIKRDGRDGPDAEDGARYQTIYAARDGAAAAPTAGLHFTPALFDALEKHGVGRAFVTLHVGAGTFLPVTAEDTAAHVMHSEHAEIPPETAAAVNAALAEGRRVVCAGTTALRALESAAAAPGGIQAFSGETDLFITPGYEFKICGALLTNFHLPRSTLFMLVAAFAGLDTIKAAYAHAAAARYRFFSYGDACLLEPAP